jgi:hypothetical protein
LADHPECTYHADYVANNDDSSSSSAVNDDDTTGNDDDTTGNDAEDDETVTDLGNAAGLLTVSYVGLLTTFAAGLFVQ